MKKLLLGLAALSALGGCAVYQPAPQPYYVQSVYDYQPQPAPVIFGPPQVSMSLNVGVGIGGHYGGGRHR